MSVETVGNLAIRFKAFLLHIVRVRARAQARNGGADEI
jgi:hypothetical protein